MPIYLNIPYVITEWDDSLSVVVITEIDSTDLVMRYEDGEAYRATIQYFRSLSPQMVN